MEIFISWSGPRSRALAEALRNWLPKIINALRPWISSADIDKGSRWASDVASRLEAARVGLICLTPGNVHADWLLFESGALSRTLDNTFVCPVLIDLEPSDIKAPLAQFQATRASKDEMKQLVRVINTTAGVSGISDAHLDEAFEVWWPKLENAISTLPSEGPIQGPTRSDRDLLEEVLATVRSQARATTGPTAAPSVAAPSKAASPKQSALETLTEQIKHLNEVTHDSIRNTFTLALRVAAYDLGLGKSGVKNVSVAEDPTKESSAEVTLADGRSKIVTFFPQNIQQRVREAFFDTEATS